MWIYQAARLLSQSEIDYITSELTSFVNSWESHGSKVDASFNISSNLFVILSADESSTTASGCSIDKSVHIMQKIGQDLNIDFFNRTNIAYVSNGEVCIAKLKDFKNQISAGAVGENTIVFNNTITHKYQLANNWKVEAKNSWVNQFFSSKMKI
jgi:hypothetical protein